MRANKAYLVGLIRKVSSLLSGQPRGQDEEEGGAVELEHVVGEVALKVNSEDETRVGTYIVVGQVPAHWESRMGMKM